MSNAFHYSETSAFTPVPYDVYDCAINQSNASNTMDSAEVIMPLCEFENRYTTQPFVDQWVANLHQPSYEPGLSFSLLAYPYIHECLGEPGFIRKRNERERMRVRNVNEGYAILRDHLPIEPTEKRLSKVETLRGAIRYIKMLEKMLHESDKEKKKNDTNEVDLNNNNNNNNNKISEKDVLNNNTIKEENNEDILKMDNSNQDLNNNIVVDLEKKKEEKSEKNNFKDITISNIDNNNNLSSSTSYNKTNKNNAYSYKNSHIEFDENNNVVYRFGNNEESTNASSKLIKNKTMGGGIEEVASTNIAKSFERLSKELMYNEQYGRKRNDSDDSSTYIDIEKA